MRKLTKSMHERKAFSLNFDKAGLEEGLIGYITYLMGRWCCTVNQVPFYHCICLVEQMLGLGTDLISCFEVLVNLI